MNINSVSGNKMIKVYNEQKRVAEKKEVKATSDSIQISTIGKSLSTYTLEESIVNSPEKVQRIANEVASGTYSRDSKLVAQKLVDWMKESKVK